MNNEQYIKWVLEVSSQEYKGDMKLLDANIKHGGLIK